MRLSAFECFLLGAVLFGPAAVFADCTQTATMIPPHTRTAFVEGALVYDTSSASLKTCDGTNYNAVGGSGSTGVADRISSSGNQAMVLAMPGGTVSFTTGSVAGTSYLDSTGRWIGPGVSITTANGISSTNGYFTGNVGIGTSAPVGMLQVGAVPASGADNGTALFDWTGPFNSGNRFNNGLKIGRRGFGATNDRHTYGIVTDYTNGNLNFIFERITDALQFSNAPTIGMSMAMTGNVGIGTTAPQATLQVSGSFTISTSAQTTTPTLYANTSGNVGIGTTNPQQKLEIAGNASVQTNYLLFGTSGAEDTGLVQYGANTLAVTKGTAALPASGFGAMTAGTFYARDTSANQRVRISGASYSTAYDGTLSWTSTQANGTPDLLIGRYAAGKLFIGATAGNADGTLVTGNVGIGTTAPQATLQVSGSFAVSTSAQTTTPTLYANASGNVGIATSSPNARLDVIGTVSATTIYATATAGIMSATTLNARYASFTTLSVAGASVSTMPGTLCGYGASIQCNGNTPAPGWCPTGWTAQMLPSGDYTCAKN